MKKKNLLILCFAVVLLSFSACESSNKDPMDTQDNQMTQSTEPIVTTQKETEETTENITSKAAVSTEETDQETIMSEFEALFEQSDISLKDLGEYVKEHISNVSAENASVMVLKMEDYMKEHLSEMEEAFNAQTVQEKFLEDFSSDVDLNDPDDFDDSAIKELILEAKEKGYKVDHAEGMVFPVLDYSYLKNFNEYASPDIRDYIDILAMETDQVFAKDAALLIGWDDVVDRALMQEKYLNEYDQSELTEDIKALYKRYIYITLSGLDNTPLFDYETKAMKEEAKVAYEAAISDNEQSEYINILSEFMDLLKENEYKLSDEVESFRIDKIEIITTLE